MSTTQHNDPTICAMTGRRVAVANGRRDPMATAEHTATLVDQLRERGADVTVLPHEGGHTIDPAQLPCLARFVRAGFVGKELTDGS